MEADMQQDAYLANQYLKANVAEEEIKGPIGRFKLRQATGIDSMSNRLLKLLWLFPV